MRVQADQVAGVILAAVGAGVMLVSRTYPAGRVGPGPGTLPFLLGGILFVLAAYLAVVPLFRRTRAADEGESRGA
ncbi:MAG TPA: hypothetical protein GX513_02850, partial [Firmicutes bacterium]|nr:hypothetical protein [Bacillota bacterium]